MTNFYSPDGGNTYFLESFGCNNDSRCCFQELECSSLKKHRSNSTNDCPWQWPARLPHNCPESAMSVLHCQGPWPHGPPQQESPTLFPLNRKSALGAAHSIDEEMFSWSRTGFQGDGRSCYHRCQSCSTWLLVQFSHFRVLWSDEELIAHIFVDCVEAVLCCLVEVVLCW